MRRTKILVVDDEHLIRWSLEQNLKKQGYEVFTAGNGEDALRLVREEQPDLVLLDIQLPGISGLEVLEKVKEFDDDIIVIMVTAHGGLETAVTAMRIGAYDYLNKPFNLDEMAIVIRKALETSELRREVASLRSEHKKVGPPNIIGNSRHMQNILSMMEKVARSEAATVLIQGESGTGKELVAKWIHYKSNRADKPFMAINCAAVPATLLESELFGHEKGAFTDAKVTKKGLFELADGGTVFLDEIGETSPSFQVKLLRVLQEGEVERLGGRTTRVDLRLVAATNQDLRAAVKEGRFREDLYYRLNVIALRIPPLRERRDDILLLAEHFLRLYGERNGRHLAGLSRAAAEALLRYDWPGNVRELENTIERAVVLSRGAAVEVEDLPVEVRSGTGGSTDGKSLTFAVGTPLAEIERRVIHATLGHVGGDKRLCAQLLGIATRTIYRRLEEERGDEGGEHPDEGATPT
jgi:two-component system, NtrC family, response regulator AtoC